MSSDRESESSQSSSDESEEDILSQILPGRSSTKGHSKKSSRKKRKYTDVEEEIKTSNRPVLPQETKNAHSKGSNECKQDPLDKPKNIGPGLPPGFQKSESIGPALPPGFEKSDSIEPTLPTGFKSSENVGPALPPGFEKKHNIGPALPPGFENKKNIGPSLPPGFEKTQNVRPALPPGFETSHSDSDSSSNASEHNVTSQPQSDSEGDAGDMIGPLPGTSTGTTEMSAAEEFEKRARKMKDKLLGKEAPEVEEPASRETWMTELPDGMSKDFGLGPRTFRSKAPAEQDSSWTDTPSSKNKEKQEKGSKKRSAEKVPRSEKEIEIEKAIEKYNKKQRKESLMDMHTKKLKKKHKKDKDKPKERRAFSREDDLKVNKFDDAQKKSILKKAALLDTRFSHGNKKFI